MSDSAENKRLNRLEQARLKVKQAQAYYDTLKAKEAAEERKRDTRRKVILGGLILEAAGKDEQMSRLVDTLRSTLTREHDLRAFANWETPKPSQP